MLRITVYGLLLFLTAGTAYLHHARNTEKAVTEEVLKSFEETPQATREAPDSSYEEQLHGKASEGPAVTAQQSLSEAPLEPKNTDVGTRRTAARAVEKFNSGDYEGALPLFQEAAEKDGRLWSGVGISYFKLGDDDKALQFLERSLEQNENDFVSHKFLAFTYYKKDDLEKSLSHAEKARALKNDPEVLNLYEKVVRERSTQDRYVDESTLHFKVLFDGYQHGGISRKVIGILEDAYGVVGRELGSYPQGPVTVVLYTGRDFFDITRAPGWSGGIYDGKIRIPVRGAEANEALLRRVLFHEYTHAVVRSITSRCPQWINEGLAEYFSGTEVKKTGQVISFQAIESSFSWLDQRGVGLAYQQSHEAVAYLIERYGLFKVREFLTALARGGDYQRAFREAFGMSYASFISEWGKG